LGGQGAGAIEHGRRDVDALSASNHLGERADHEPTTARHVQHRVVGPGPAGVDEQAQGLLTGDGLRRGERGGLAGGLIEDQVAVARVGHGSEPSWLWVRKALYMESSRPSTRWLVAVPPDRSRSMDLRGSLVRELRPQRAPA